MTTWPSFKNKLIPNHKYLVATISFKLLVSPNLSLSTIRGGKALYFKSFATQDYFILFGDKYLKPLIQLIRPVQTAFPF